MHLLRRGIALLPALFLALAATSGCAGSQTALETPFPVVDSAQIMGDLRVLAADSMEGRAPGTEGNARARRFLLREFESIGLQHFPGGFEHPFSFDRNGAVVDAVNLVGYVEGAEPTGPVVVVTAHYDHVGVQNGEIYNGADDNASGVAALLALGRHLREHPPTHTVLLVALDAEEMGLRGARAFVESPPVPLERIALNVNFDMVSRGDRGELYAAGTYHYPQLRPILEEVALEAPITLLLGHDSPDLPPGEDWTMMSDHAAFHRAGIPFVYFGVEDHPDYHRPSDVADKVDAEFFAGSVATIIAAVERLDAALGSLRDSDTM